MSAAYKRVEIRETDFSLEEEYRSLIKKGSGACVLFTGLVRDLHPGDEETVLELEHYAGMTESSIEKIVDEASTRWSILASRVIHRVGRLVSGDQIVLVGVSSAHRGDAFAACEFIMDYLKTQAPIWKKESVGDQSHWVEARSSDTDATKKWQV